MTDILAQKEKTHGVFAHTARTAQNLKTVLHDSLNWDKINIEQAEALEAMCVKMARIVCGNAEDPDHWLDIAGYAALGRRSVSSEH